MFFKKLQLFCELAEIPMKFGVPKGYNIFE